jgi:hypothetical protein
MKGKKIKIVLIYFLLPTGIMYRNLAILAE